MLARAGDNNNSKIIYIMKKTLVIILIILQSCNGRLPYKLSKDIYLDYDRNGYVSLISLNEKYPGTSSNIIYGDILKINCDNEFIIAIVKPIDKITKKEDPYSKLSRIELEKRIEKNTTKEYWIVNKKEITENNTNFIYGPLGKTEFEIKQKKLGIPISLKFLEMNDFLR
jgi:hypothetical protein